MLKIPFLHYVLNFVTMFVKGFCSKQNAHHHDSGFVRKLLRATCVISVLFGAFTLPTTSFAWSGSSSYDCGNNGDFPMSFAGCKPGYYYEDWSDRDTSLTPEDVGECIACPSGYTCLGGFTGPRLSGPYEYTGGGSMYDCGNDGEFPMSFGGCRAGYYYEDWQYADSTLHPDEVAECIVCPEGYTCTGGFAGPVAGRIAKFTITTTSDTDSFKFSMSAAGIFWVDWGDGTIEEIDRTDDTTPTTYSHDYDDADEYVIRFGGLATEYNDYDGSIDEEEVNFAAISFGKYAEFNYGGARQIASISGSLGAMFPTLPGNADDLSKHPRFPYTFYNAENITSIPADLFAGVSGAAGDMFNGTFRGCSSLESIPADLFAGVLGAAEGMFRYTFNGCSALESIPTGLFSGVSGAADYMFYNTFYGCSSLESIPSTLFSGVSGAANFMFSGTFNGCSSLTSIPSELFSGVSGAADYMFSYTFGYCSSLASIPSGLFSGVSGAAEGMFSDTFHGCSSLTSIPSGLFSGVSGAAVGMFHQTFRACSSLTSIPADLFAGVNGTPKSSMFYKTFYNDSNLNEFYYGNDNSTTSYIPPHFFGSMATTPTANNFMTDVFNGTGIATSCQSGTTQYTTGFESYFNSKVSCVSTTPYTITFNLNSGSWPVGVVVPQQYTETDSTVTLPTPVRSGYFFAGWYDNSAFNGRAISDTYGLSGNKTFYAKWEVAKFTITTTSDTDSFKFSMSAAGTFWVDWGDGTIEEIDRTDDTEPATYSHDYNNADEYVIGFTGLATEYNDYNGDIGDEEVNFAAISFGQDAEFNYDGAGQIASISGSLGAMFPTLPGNADDLSKHPRFAYTFYDAENLTSIPSGLFSGVSGAANGMFSSSFSGCSSLESIPSGLFSGVAGAATGMFSNTFNGCSSLTSIPSGLFSGVSGAANSMFSSTFNGCSALESIPSGLFSGVSGAAESMFDGTFSDTSITSIPTGLFSGVSGAANSMFSNTFNSCSALESIPSGLFSGVSGAAYGMFNGTFSRCSSLTSIPSGLFSGVSGAADRMFYYTFGGCSSLESIPADLFAGVNGTPKQYMFYGTFYNDSNLNEFYYGNDNSTTSYIPPHFFGSMATTPSADNFMTNVFYNTGIATSCPANTYLYTTGFESYWNGKVSCEVCPDGKSSPAGSTSVEQCVAQSCPVDHFVPENHPEMCFPHMLHVGDEVVYLSETRKTTPALNVLFDGNVFYANMTNAQTPMTSGSQHYFKAKYNDEIYYIYDDTLSGESE